VVSEGPKELCEYVRSRLPVRVRLVGKDRIDDMTLIAVQEWPVERLLACGRGSAEEERAVDDVAASVSRVYESVRGSEKRYGFFWSFVLMSAVSAICQLVLQWWLSRPANRVKMAAWNRGSGAQR
jgi:hypothetical protein